MHVEDLNGPVWELDDAHPAKRFLDAFVDCRSTCAGRELGLDGRKSIDQQWRSASDGRVWTFSGFVYMFLCFDIVLDGFLESTPNPTASETAAAKELPLLRSMMHECAEAARESGNGEILELTGQVLGLLNRWDEYLHFRKVMMARADG